MAGKAILKETIKKNTIKDMQKLGVFKPEYDAIIDVYAEMMEQYQKIFKKFKESGYKYYETTETGSKKAPIVATLESLRKDILQYSDRLCLNPKANQVDGKDRGGGNMSTSLGDILKDLEK